MTRVWAILASSLIGWAVQADEPPAKTDTQKPPTVAELIRQVDQLQGKERRILLQELGRRRDAAAVPPLLKVLKEDKDAAMRNVAAEALGALGRLAKAAVPDLLNALKDSDAGVRETAAESLADIGLESAKVVPALIKLLDDADTNVRCAAARSLGDFKLQAVAAVPHLEKLRKNDQQLFVREAADDAIQAISKAANKIRD